MLSGLALNKKASGGRHGHPELGATQPAKDLKVQAIVVPFVRILRAAIVSAEYVRTLLARLS